MKETAVFVPPAVRDEMEAEADRAFPNETGGILLGYADRDDPAAIQVLIQIGPGPGARHEPHRFEPDSPWQTARLAKAYSDTERLAAYLGDWHSHPHGTSKPSSLDRGTARRIARTKTARCPHPMIAILYGLPRQWRLSIYRSDRWRLRPVTHFSD